MQRTEVERTRPHGERRHGPDVLKRSEFIFKVRGVLSSAPPVATFFTPITVMFAVSPMQRALLFTIALASLPRPALADALVHLAISPSRYADAREALVDAIETEGLVPSPPSRFGDMLARTGAALEQPVPVYAEAEVMHFCSARIAWQLARENPVNVAQCPLSMAIYTLPGEAGVVHLAWRTAAGDSPGTRAADALLQRIARQTADNAGRSSLGR